MMAGGGNFKNNFEEIVNVFYKTNSLECPTPTAF